MRCRLGGEKGVDQQASKNTSPGRIYGQRVKVYYSGSS